jgi:CHAT domain-containing protein/tetratricopeptide (TPR) repeat protein
LLVLCVSALAAQAAAPPAELTAEQAVQLKERDRLGRWVNGQSRLGRYAEAQPFAARALELTRAVRGEPHPEVAAALGRLAGLCELAGDWGAAVKHREAAVAQRIRLHGAGDWRTADARVALRFAHKAATLGKAERAEVLAALRQEQEAKRQPGAEAERMLTGVLPAYRKCLGGEDLAVARVLVALGVRRYRRGDRRGALPAWREALAIYRQALPQGHPAIAGSLNNLGLVQGDLGRHAEALKSHEEALAIRRKALPGGHPEIAASLNNLGVVQGDLGRHREALKSHEEALALFRKALPPGHPHIALSLNNLGNVQRALGKHEEALKSHEEALALYRKALPRGHPHIAQSLINLGNVQRALGRPAEALKSHEEALAIRRQALPPGHPEIALSLTNLVVSVMASGTDRRSALAWLKEATGIYQRHLSRLALAQAEAEQLRAAGAERRALDLFVSLAGQDRAEQACSLVVASKGAVTARQRWGRASRQSDRRSAELLEDLRQANLALLRFALDDRPDRRGAGRVDARAEMARLRELGRRRDRLEEELARRSASYRRLLRQDRRGAAEVRAALPAGAALIDFLEYSRASPPAKGKAGLTEERRLLAFVVRPGQEKAALVRLGGAHRLADLIDAWRSTHGSGKKPPPGQADPAVALRRELWLPLEKHLEGARLVLASPDGPLNGLPLAALPGAKPGTFLVQQYAFAVVPVPQLLPELLAPRRRQGQPTLLLVGGIDFGKGKPPAKGALPYFPALPGTESEVNDLRRRFEDAFPDAPAPRRLRKDNATRAAFLKEAPGARFLHVATHGFFAPASEPSALAAASRAGLLGAGALRWEVVGRHPALLSGLVFAGVNDATKREEAVLTALEATELRLENAELVTLSACDTGLGAVAGGEGVLGLQRAFQLAGARSVVASLWSVSDAATSVLMEQFYTRLWQKKVAPLEALRQAQLFVLKNPDRVRRRARELRDALAARGFEDDAEVGKPAARPKQGRSPVAWWAPWVLSGDWR